jgi:hypothetical protein
MSTPSLDLGVRIHALAVAVENVLVAGVSQERHLRPGYPPFFTDDQPTPLEVGLRHFGGEPGALFDLWCMCRATEQLRRVWTGQEPAPPPAPTAAADPVATSAPEATDEPK